MKLLKILPVIALLFMSSCGEEKEAEEKEDIPVQTEVRKPSETNKQWIAAWNRNNPGELDSLTANDAVLYMQGKSMNADSISSWYKMAAPMMKDLVTRPEMTYTGKDIAYEAGTYKHKIKNDSLDTTYEGSYTFIWKREDNDWRLQVLNITDNEEAATPAAPEK
jgi:ketosteroid isomerase-like protein